MFVKERRWVCVYGWYWRCVCEGEEAKEAVLFGGKGLIKKIIYLFFERGKNI